MSDGGLTVLDGTQLRDIIGDLSLPESEGDTVNGARVLELAESRASSSLFGLSLPESVKSDALKRIDLDALIFRSTQLHRDHQASSKLKDYVTAIADQLKDEPLVVAILDGKSLRLFMEDEDDFAMLAENLFTDLDTEDRGKISKNEMQNALVHMGVEMGIPPFSEYPLLNHILKKHGAEGDEELGQAQFAQLLQPILADLADALAENHVVVIQNIKITNGSKLRKILAFEEQLNDVIEKAFQEKHNTKDEQSDTKIIRGFLHKNGKDLGLPPSEGDEAVILLYDSVFADVENNAIESEKDEFGVLVRKILEKFAEQLEANPVFHDNGN